MCSGIVYVLDIKDVEKVKFYNINKNIIHQYNGNRYIIRYYFNR